MAGPPPAPKRKKKKEMKIGDIPEYVAKKHSFKVSRITAYNWVSKGVGGQFLKVNDHGRFITTTKENVDAFVSIITRR